MPMNDDAELGAIRNLTRYKVAVRAWRLVVLGLLLEIILMALSVRGVPSATIKPLMTLTLGAIIIVFVIGFAANLSLMGVTRQYTRANSGRIDFSRLQKLIRSVSSDFTNLHSW